MKFPWFIVKSFYSHPNAPYCRQWRYDNVTKANERFRFEKSAGAETACIIDTKKRTTDPMRTIKKWAKRNALPTARLCAGFKVTIEELKESTKKLSEKSHQPTTAKPKHQHRRQSPSA